MQHLFCQEDTPDDTEAKLQLVQIYNDRLTERERRRAFIIDRGLLHVRRQQVQGPRPACPDVGPALCHTLPATSNRMRPEDAQLSICFSAADLNQPRTWQYVLQTCYRHTTASIVPLARPLAPAFLAGMRGEAQGCTNASMKRARGCVHGGKRQAKQWSNRACCPSPPQALDKKRSAAEREAAVRMRVFARFLPRAEHDALTDGLLLEHRLRARIQVEPPASSCLFTP